jgi:AcrR family transcriptional regulator
VVDVTRPGRDLWLLAGQELLRTGGVGAVKLRALTTLMGRTTGSFYHHFDGMPAYLDALARYFGDEQVRGYLATVDHPDPRQRLRRLMAIARDERMLPLDAAMRDWAGSNPLAADAVRTVDAHLLRFIARAFQELGYERGAARLRARLLLSSGVARVLPPWKSAADDADGILAILAP